MQYSSVQGCADSAWWQWWACCQGETDPFSMSKGLMWPSHPSSWGNAGGPCWCQLCEAWSPLTTCWTCSCFISGERDVSQKHWKRRERGEMDDWWTSFHAFQGVCKMCERQCGCYRQEGEGQRVLRELTDLRRGQGVLLTLREETLHPQNKANVGNKRWGDWVTTRRVVDL